MEFRIVADYYIVKHGFMAFGVVANWGEHGKTIIRICELDKLFESAVFGIKTEKP